MASAHAIIGLILTIIAIIVSFSLASWLELRATDHKSMIIKNKAILRFARAAHCDCRRAETVSILVILAYLLSIIVIIGTIIVIIRIHKTVICIGI